LYFAKCQALFKSAYHKAKVELQLSDRILQHSSASSEDVLVGRQEKDAGSANDQRLCL